MTHWEIVDDNGTIHSGTKTEMSHAFDQMINEMPSDEWDFDWKGDLKLIHVINIYK